MGTSRSLVWLCDSVDNESMEDNNVIPSRLIAQRISGQMDSFELVGFGPFELSSEELNEQLSASTTQSSSTSTTLVVNDVDRWIPELSDWMDAHFGALIPQWRRDDAQISLANDGGGIGPHVDSYDVFLIQTAGEREWQVGVDDFFVSIQEEFDHMIEACSEKGVRILNVTSLLESTAAKAPKIARIKVKPGDCLYLPPRVMHWGTATTDGCMTLSVGCRAPSAKDLIGRLSERMLIGDSSSTSRKLTEASSRRYTDELNVKTKDSPACSRLSAEVKEAMKVLILDAIEKALNDDEHVLDSLVGKIVTEPNRLSADDVSFPVSLNDMDDEWRTELGVWGDASSCIEEALANGNGCLRRAEGVAFAWSRIDGKGNIFSYRLYAHGRDPIAFSVPSTETELHLAIELLMDRICGGDPLDKLYFEKLGTDIDQHVEVKSFLLTLVQEGLLYGDAM
ncbi:MAG: hypothetical protein SGILL_008237 [Bacillariaceae sp.]